MKTDKTIYENSIDIVIVNYNSSLYLEKCIQSIKMSDDRYDIVFHVVDNHSSDGIDRVVGLFPDVNFVLNKKNKGFAAAVNQALQCGTSPYVMVINPDAQIVPGFFQPIVDYMKRTPDVGIIGPQILNTDGSIQGSARAFPNMLTALYGRSSPLTRYFPNNPISRANIVTIESDGRTPQEVDWVSGACMLVRRKAIKTVGMMDETFFMYWEDADWCRRMWQSGWKVIYYPVVSLYHHVGKSSATRPLRSIYNFHLSSYHLYEKYSKGLTQYLLPLAFFALYTRGCMIAAWNMLQRYIFKRTSQVHTATRESTALSSLADKHLSRKKVNVLRVISRINIGGPAIHVNLLQNGLNKTVFDSTLVAGSISPSEGNMNYIIQAEANHFISIPEMQRELNPWKDLVSLYKLFHIIRYKKPHIVHSHTAKAGTIARLSAILCNLFCRQNIKTVHTFHGHVFAGYFSKIKSRIFVLTERLMSVFTDKIIAISPTQREDLVNKYRISKSDKVDTIKLGFDLDPFVMSSKSKGRFRVQLGIDNTVRLVGIVGRLVPIKNHFLFLEAAKQFISQHPDMKIRFAVIGDGEMKEELQKFCIQQGISEHVRFCGWIKNIAHVYADLDVLALTSINEGTPVSIIEAMAAGVPVISTDAGGIKDLLGEQIESQPSNGFRICERGILLPRNAPQSLADSIRYIVSNAENGGRQMVSAARQFVLSDYHQDRLIQDIRSLYYNLLK